MLVDYGLTDIVAERFDLGVRLGELVAQDMIAVPLGPASRMSIVGSPDYLRERPAPTSPQDLLTHDCITLRLPTYGGIYAWELEQGDEKRQMRVSGQLVFNGVYPMIAAAVAGYGLAFVPHKLVEPHVAAGRLQRVLETWCPTWPGLHAYYPSRRQSSKALGVVVDALRIRAADS